MKTGAYLPGPMTPFKSLTPLRRLRHLFVMTLAAVLLVGVLCGCVTRVYKVQPDHEKDISDCYRLVDRTIKNNSLQWQGPTAVKIGANEKGFTIIEADPAIQRTDGGYRIYGRPASYRWEDVTDVSVRAQVTFLFLIFMDPTMDSYVQITLRDGQKVHIFLQGGQFPEGCLGCFPLWPFSPKWSRADRLGKAIQTIVDSKKLP